MRLLALFDRFFLVLFFQASILFVGAPHLHAQATPTASRQTELSAFGTFTFVNPDRAIIYPQNSNSNYGATFGFDYTRYASPWFTPSLEIRTKFATGTSVNESTYGGGLRVEHRFGSFYPYGDSLMSYGKITFNHPDRTGPGPPYTHDDAFVTSFGLGCDIDITERWTARVDYQFEHWNVSYNEMFDPRALSFGVLYRIPFGYRKLPNH
jgi:hypothetical protein